MNIQSCFDALEKQNEEFMRLQNSSEMFVGKTIKVLLSFNIKRVCDCIVSAIRSKRIKNDRKKGEEFFYAKGEPINETDRVAVYSCITGCYDKLNKPLLVDDELSYFCVSDSSNAMDSMWRYIEIPKEAKGYKNAIINRFCKLNPFVLFPDYDYSIYIDGNIEIVSDVRNLCAVARNSKIGIAMHLHDDRDCVYNESSICKLYKRGNLSAIEKQMKGYRQEGFPEHFGMVEATIIIVDLKNPIAKKIMGDWWNELLNSDSGRDQLSFPYILWKNGFQISDVGCLGNNRRKNPKFRTKLHLSKYNKG